MKNLTWQNPEQLFVAQVLINKVKSKCCGIKVLYYFAKYIILLGQVTYIPENMREIYIHMIRKAQEFMNENHYADISRVHCLLRKMMPKEYHDLIDQIKECQDPHVMFNVNGGNNVIAPNASQAKQNIHDDSSSSIKDNFQS